eukprot:g12990.t1
MQEESEDEDEDNGLNTDSVSPSGGRPGRAAHHQAQQQVRDHQPLSLLPFEPDSITLSEDKIQHETSTPTSLYLSIPAYTLKTYRYIISIISERSVRFET